MIAPGSIVAGYRIEGVLGQGGMGVVYRAMQLSLERIVALKVLAESLSNDSTFRERFRREGLVQAAIDHPHIVTVYEAGESDYGLFLAMRLVHGPNLKDLILSRDLDAKLSIHLLTQVAGALETAHEAGLVHRDIKPQNILIGARQHAYLADFGLTKALGATGLTRTGQFVGTLDYISPEQIRGEPPSARSDIYALAAVLYECLTGSVPYPKESDAAVLYAHLSDPPPSVTEQRTDLPRDLDAVIARAMSKEPADRHESAIHLLRHAERALGSAQFTLAAPAPPATPEEAGFRDPTMPARTETGATGVAEPVSEPDATIPSAVEPAGTVAASAAGAVVTKAANQTATEQSEAATEAQEEVDTETAEEAQTGETRPTPVKETVAAEAARETRAAPPPAETVLAPQARPETVAAPPEPLEASPQFEKRRKVALLAGAAALVAGLAAAGYGIGAVSFDSGKKVARVVQPRPLSTQVAPAGPISLTYRSDWRRADETSVDGVKLDSPVGLVPRSGPEGSALIAGATDADGSTLLPAELRSGLGEAEREAVRLGEIEAYRYVGLKPAGVDGDLTVYVVPTNAGVVTLGCLAAPAAPAAVLQDCERIAATLRLSGVRTYPIGPSRVYASKLRATVQTLKGAREGGLRALAGASTPQGQASAADVVAAAYVDAARRLERLKITPESAPANARIARALGQAGDAYGELASAARAKNQARYDAARRHVRKQEAAARRAIRALRLLGYATG